ncbi:MAG: NAD(P)-dependent oxidoreductase [Gemmataceae bacterium]
MNHIGVIGLGLLGSAIASRLSPGNQQLHGFDIDPAKRESANSAGVSCHISAMEVARLADVIILSLPEDRHVDEVLAIIRPSLKPHCIILDTTTGDPECCERRLKDLSALGVSYLDCTVAGSSELLREGKALLFVGGNAQAFEKVRPILDQLAEKHFLIGASGAGSRMKLVHNLALGMNRAVLAETLMFAKAMGLDQRNVLQVLMQSPAASMVMQHKGAKMIERDFQPQARLHQHAKDVRLILDIAKTLEQQLPLSQLHLQLLEKVIQDGDGDLDNCAIIKAFEKGK